MTQIERFGKYILLEKIATGGMAEIYLARAPGASGINKFVAIKRILPQYSDNPEFIEMFKSEAKIAINLKHSNIVSIYEFGVEKGQFFLVMDFVEGKNLRQAINRMKQVSKYLAADQILYIIREAAAGLDSAHRCLDGTTGRPLNITHRDISPQNLMVSYEGEVKIVDFGIAKTETQIEATKAGTLKGKFGYMSPEQAEGIQVDLRTDIFSLGIVLWEMIANDRLFMANNEMNTLRKIRDCQIPSLRKINPKVPEDLEKIVNKALAKDRNLRYQTAAAFHRDLNTFLNKNYPSFSPHDFGNSIKTLFSDEIVSVRNKLVEYSKLQMEDTATPAIDDLTRTQTSTQTPVDMPVSKSEPAEINTQSDISFDNLVEASMQLKSILGKEKTATGISISKSQQPLAVQKNAATAATPSQRINNPSRPRPQPSRGVSIPIPHPSFLVFMILLGGIWFVGVDKIMGIFRPPVDVCATNQDLPECQTEEETSSSKTAPTKVAQKYRVNITSFPPGAQVFIDGKDMNAVTPWTFDIEPRKTHDITLKLPGYLIYRSDYTADKSTDTFTATLQKTSEGYLDIRVFPSTAKIYINKELLMQAPPIKRYAVPANKELIVRAIDVDTQAEAQEKVVVEENRIKSIELFLNKKPTDR